MKSSCSLAAWSSSKALVSVSEACRAPQRYSSTAISDPFSHMPSKINGTRKCKTSEEVVTDHCSVQCSDHNTLSRLVQNGGEQEQKKKKTISFEDASSSHGGCSTKVG